MADDLLAKFRPSAPAPTRSPEKEGSSGGGGLPAYQAFDAKDKLKRMQIRQVMAAFNSPAYAHLLTIVSDGLHGTELGLIYTFQIVKIKGRNLQPITDAIEMGDCAFIQDYDPRFFAPPEPNEPIIESIEIVMKDGQEEKEKKD